LGQNPQTQTLNFLHIGIAMKYEMDQVKGKEFKSLKTTIFHFYLFFHKFMHLKIQKANFQGKPKGNKKRTSAVFPVTLQWFLKRIFFIIDQ
jgi:hypothetical protein